MAPFTNLAERCNFGSRQAFQCKNTFTDIKTDSNFKTKHLTNSQLMAPVLSNSRSQWSGGSKPDCSVQDPIITS